MAAPSVPLPPGAPEAHRLVITEDPALAAELRAVGCGEAEIRHEAFAWEIVCPVNLSDPSALAWCRVYLECGCERTDALFELIDRDGYGPCPTSNTGKHHGRMSRYDGPWRPTAGCLLRTGENVGDDVWDLIDTARLGAGAHPVEATSYPFSDELQLRVVDPGDTCRGGRCRVDGPGARLCAWHAHERLGVRIEGV